MFTILSSSGVVLTDEGSRESKGGLLPTAERRLAFLGSIVLNNPRRDGRREAAFVVVEMNGGRFLTV
jgi:hypothetical protein